MLKEKISEWYLFSIFALHQKSGQLSYIPFDAFTCNLVSHELVISFPIHTYFLRQYAIMIQIIKMLLRMHSNWYSAHSGFFLLYKKVEFEGLAIKRLKKEHLRKFHFCFICIHFYMFIEITATLHSFGLYVWNFTFCAIFVRYSVYEIVLFHHDHTSLNFCFRIGKKALLCEDVNLMCVSEDVNLMCVSFSILITILLNCYCLFILHNSMALQRLSAVLKHYPAGSGLRYRKLFVSNVIVNHLYWMLLQIICIKYYYILFVLNYLIFK